MNDAILKFSFIKFLSNAVVYIIILTGFVILYEYNLKTIFVCLGVFLLFMIVSAFKAKTFIINNRELTVKYVFLNLKKRIKLNTTTRIFYHKKKIEREWHYIEVKLENRKEKTFHFYYVNNESLNTFFEHLKTTYNAVLI